MNIRVVTMMLMLVLGLLLTAGCTEKEDPAWGKNQKMRLQELLNRPNIKYGEITVDNKNKEWIIPSLEFVPYETDQFRSVCTAESVTGTDVALDPITEPGLLAKRLEIRGLACKSFTKTGEAQPETELASFRVNNAVVENLKGSKELQASLLNFGGNAAWPMLQGASFDRFDIAGIAVTEKNEPLLNVESCSMQGLAGGFAGPVQTKNLVITAKESVKTISVAEIGAKKIGSKGLFDLMLSIDNVASQADVLSLILQTDFLAEDMYYNDLKVVVDESVPPIGIKSMTGTTVYDGVNGKSTSAMDSLTIAPETLQFMLPRELKNYPFKPVAISSSSEVEVSNKEGLYVLDYKKIHVSDPSLGSMDLAMKLSGDKNILQTSMSGDVSGMQLNSFTLNLTDIALSDFVIDMVALGSGQPGMDPQSMRGLASNWLKMQCSQLSAGMRGACENTAAFIEQRGSIEYAFTPDQPFSLDQRTLFEQKDAVVITSKFMPPK